jgi:uncharacterized membrane protein HdeD (DUF308 family)
VNEKQDFVRADRPRFIEPADRAQTPQEARQRRSTAMISSGVIGVLIGLLSLGSGSFAALLLGLLGIGLLVGGLVIRL